MGFASTAGTTPWHMIRFALEAEGATVCLLDAAVMTAYTPTHHNCSDRASLTADGVRYDITDPDNPASTISAFRGTTRLWGPVSVMTTMCLDKTRTNTRPSCKESGGCVGQPLPAGR